MDASGDFADVTFRSLEPAESARLSEAIRAAYGETYDVPWVYDVEEVESRLAAGTYVSWVAESGEGELLCHEGMSLAAVGDVVGHSGQAVTMPVARGQHLFTRTKRHLMEWAAGRGMAGIFSEATAAHPYSQRANLELGAHETGFLLGWIPASVANDAAAAGEPGHRPAGRRPRAPRRLLRRRLPHQPHRRRRAEDAIAAPGPDRPRRHRGRLRPRSRAARLRAG